METNTILGMAKINFRQSKTAYLVSGIVVALFMVSEIITSLILRLDRGEVTTSLSCYVYLLPLLMSILIPAQNFRKLMSLGAKCLDFFKACILNYLCVSAAVSALSMALMLSWDQLIIASGTNTLNLFEVFGFMRGGPLVAFVQMTALLLLLCCALHSLTLAQGRWYGYAVDAAIIAVISVFTPIEPLRNAEIWFFNLIIFHQLAFVQIIACLVVAAAVYLAGLVPLRGKRV
ncbi:MAG: hypothetical protein LBD25_01065 [Coriobacteriales bacterium]|jgi:hypothetical protein|nr:hypothetical protein [Coriobacteriales bacterium]